ncbi:MAG: HAD family hydrolase [Verrucomicrobia bacterium]|nr:MAG: HAD family hydrolase [Verrucomicrobiota bacterium]
MADGKTPAVFFDRDGTIMHDVNYCSDPKDMHVFPFVAGSLRKLKAHGFKLIMITNQSGIGRGYFTREQYSAVHAEVLRQLGEPLIDATYVCPDVPGVESKCRKPAPGMILQGAGEHSVDLSRSIMIGVASTNKDKQTLVDWGFRLVEYHKMPEYRAIHERAAAD